MYSLEEKKKAVELYIQYDKQLSKTIKAIGYPSSRTTLREWYYEFRDGIEFIDTYTRKKKYTEDQKEEAVKYYFDHGSNVTKTIAALGYPCRAILKVWIDEKFPGQQKDLEWRKQLVMIERTKFEVVDYIMESTDSPRKAPGIIYDGIEKKHLYNSQDNLDLGLQVVKSTLTTHISENPIEYELIKGYKLKDIDIFEMDTLINAELEDAKKYIYPLNPKDDSTEMGMNKYYKVDSEGELKFAQQLDNDKKVKLFTKLHKDLRMRSF